MDRSHRQQTPSPHTRPPLHGTGLIASRIPLPTLASPAWTGLIASRLPSPHVRPPPHGQVSSPTDSLSPPSPSPAWTGLSQQTPLCSRPPSPAWTGLTPADSPLPRMDRSHRQQSPLPALALPRMDRSHRQQTPLSPRASPAWTGLTASRLPSPHARLPPHGQVSPPADSPLPTPALPRMDRSHRQQTPLSIAPPNPFPSVSP